MNYFHEFQKILPIKWEKKATNLILMANYEIFMIKKAHMYMKWNGIKFYFFLFYNCFYSTHLHSISQLPSFIIFIKLITTCRFYILLWWPSDVSSHLIERSSLHLKLLNLRNKSTPWSRGTLLSSLSLIHRRRRCLRRTGQSSSLFFSQQLQTPPKENTTFSRALSEKFSDPAAHCTNVSRLDKSEKESISV